VRTKFGIRPIIPTDHGHEDPLLMDKAPQWQEDKYAVDHPLPITWPAIYDALGTDTRHVDHQQLLNACLLVRTGVR
jgi:hypothetical protein